MSTVRPARFEKRDRAKNQVVSFYMPDEKEVKSIVDYIKSNNLCVVHLFEPANTDGSVKFDRGYYIASINNMPESSMGFWRERSRVNKEIMNLIDVSDCVGLSQEVYEELEGMLDSDHFTVVVIEDEYQDPED